MSSEQPTLARRLGTGDAVVVGLSAMIGAGVFAVFAPAAEAAGGMLLVGLGIAAAVAFCNAVSSAQLARASGGTYVYGREVLGPWWGFVAGWGFVIGKTAYAVANLAALRQPPEQRRWPRVLNVLGLAGCLTLVVTLPLGSVVGGLGVLIVGVLGRWLVLRHRQVG